MNTMKNLYYDLPDELIEKIEEEKERLECEEDEKRLKFCAYQCETYEVKKIRVAGGGMSDGYAYADIEIHSKGRNNDIEAVYYVKHALNKPEYRVYVGNDIEYGEYDEFKILEDGEYVLEEDLFN